MPILQTGIFRDGAGALMLLYGGRLRNRWTRLCEFGRIRRTDKTRRRQTAIRQGDEDLAL